MNKKKLLKYLHTFQETQVKGDYSNLTLWVLLVQPETAGNIGSVARIMENFNFKNLIIFNPIEKVENILSYETQGFAMHGKDVLFNAEIVTIRKLENHMLKLKEFLKRFDLVIGTTSKGKHFRNIKRLSIFPEDLTIPPSQTPINVAIMFGKESTGLTNEEISFADILIRIPTSNNYPTLNLSHACGIVLYEMFKKIHSISIGRGENPVLIADKEDRLLLYDFVQNIINKLKIRTIKEENMYFAFKNVFERTFMSKKELNLITGLFSKVSSLLNELDLYKS
jgi:TrmH family RNA methyltransferase